MSYFKGPDIEAAFPHFQPRTSVLKLLLEALRKNGAATAMVEGESGKTASSRDILQNSLAVAAGLQNAGVAAGDYVVICGDKSILAYCLLLGTMLTGATAILFPIPHADILHKLTQGFPLKAVFCDAPLLDTLKESMRHLTYQPLLVATMDERDQVVASLLTHSGQCVVHEVSDVQKHIPLVFFTSGTTGDPKGIQLKDVYAQICGMYFNFKFKTFLTASPLFWLSGLIFFISSTFHNYRLVISNSTKPSDNLLLLQKYKIDGWFVGTGSLTRYFNEPSINQYDLSSLRQVFIGGEHILSSTLESFVTMVLKNSKSTVHTMYGSTEGGLLTYTELQRKHGHFETGVCGKVFPGVEIKILDDDGNLAPAGSLGMIWAKSVSQTPGYWGRPDLNDEMLDKQGFFQTGDAGFFDKDSCLRVRGRVGDLINYQGTRVSPVEAENLLMSHLEVVDVAVVAKPHPTDVNHATAFVVLKPGATASEQDLEKFVNGILKNKTKIRGGVYCLEALPRTIIGKVQRKKLRELALKYEK